MFTLEDIKNIAIQIEENGEKTYRKLAQSSDDPEKKEIFTWMADEEKRHALWFSQIKGETAVTEEQIALAEMGKNLLQEMVKDKTFSLDAEQLAQCDDIPEIISQAREFELDTVLFYEFIESLLGDESHQEMIVKIIEEERKHAASLAEIAVIARQEKCCDKS